MLGLQGIVGKCTAAIFFPTVDCAARLIVGSRKFDHIHPVLKSLHWLLVESRIMFKTLVHTFKACERISPKYLQDLITDYVPSRSL